MSPILLALISYFGWSSGDLFGTLASRKVGGYATTFWMLFIRIGLCFLYIPFTLSELSKLTLPIILFTFILGLILVTGIVTYTEALRSSTASVSATISASYAILVIPFSVILFHERISILQIIAIGFVLTGVFLCTFNLQELRQKKIILDKGIWLSFLTMVCWGVYFTLLKIPIKQAGWFWPGFISIAVFPVIYAYTRFRKISLPLPKDSIILRNIFLFALLTGIGDFSFNAALGTGLTSIVTPIASSSPTMFVVLAFLFLKDSLQKQQIVGVVITLSGIIFLSILSV